MFDHISYEQVENRASYEVDSSEGFWNTGGQASGKPNLGYKLRQKEGYFPVPPADSMANLRSEMVATMEALGIRCEFITTRCPRGARARSTCASSRCCAWRIR